MGTNALGIFIKTDVKKYNQDSIARDLFGCSERYNPLETNLKFGQYLTIMTYENGIEILEPEFVENFVTKDDVEVKKIKEYFSNAEFIYGYMVVTGVYAYGFRYLENGETKRFRYDDGEGNLREKGTPLIEELKYLNAYYFIYKEEEEEEFMAYSFNENKEKIDGAYYSIVKSVVDDIMISRLGFLYDGNITGEDLCLEMKQYKLPNK